MSTLPPPLPSEDDPLGPPESAPRYEHRLKDAWKDKHRRRAMLSTAIRTLIAVAVMIGAFVIIPPGAIVRGDDGVRLIIGIVVLVAVIVWQVRSIYNDPVPEFRAGAALVVLSVLLVLLFSMIYCAIYEANPASFSEPMGNATAIYFTITTLATVGYGDVHAVTQSARWVVTAQMIIDLTLVVALGRVLIAAAKVGRSRQEARQAAGLPINEERPHHLHVHRHTKDDPGDGPTGNAGGQSS